MFKTDVKLVFDLIRYSEDKEKLRTLGKDLRYQKMDEDAREMLKAHIKLPEELEMKIYEDEEMEVAKGFRDWAEEERTIGREEGKLEGIRFVALRMNEKGKEIQDIADAAGVSVETVEKWINGSKA